MIGKQQPRHPHDCDCCTFLGHYGEHDLYFCPQGGHPTVIARFGEHGDYLSGLWAADFHPELNVAKKRAQNLGLIPK